MVNNPEDVLVSGEMQITLEYSFQVNKSLTLTEKLEEMENMENSILKSIEQIENVTKTKI